jgi:hypothetical protein
MEDFFVRNEKNKGYPDGKPIWFDYYYVNVMFIDAINGNSDMKLVFAL